MRRLIYPALILLPVLAHAQAKTQTSTLTAVQSPASTATLEAKANKPHVLTAIAAPVAASAAPASADRGSDIMVPVHQTVVEHTTDGVDTNDSSIGYSFNNGVTAATAPKLILASPLAMSLRDLEAEAPEVAVLLQLTVDLTGTPKNVKVLRSGGTTLDKLAVEAVSLYRFKPATQNNLPVEAPVTVEIKVKKS
jgi:TonB family protein